MCSSKFGLQSVLNRHFKTVHENLKPFECKKCSSKFGLKASLNRHFQTVHQNFKLFECQKC
jgi:uncharacterized Zn-finger protein